jgi:hypothetical protein
LLYFLSGGGGVVVEIEKNILVGEGERVGEASRTGKTSGSTF